MRAALMIEGQEGVTWDQWVALARACEDLEIETLFRSDHYLSLMGKEVQGSLDPWATLAGLAAVTTKVRLGTLVSPATFRHPSVLAKMAVTVDHISGGRVEVGLGAGWHEPEHRAYGFPFADVKTRMDVLAEQVEIVHRTWTEDGLTFRGNHYALEDLTARPKAIQQPHPPLIMGGEAKARGAALAARWADEYNTVSATPDVCHERRARIVEACEREGRAAIPFSLMTTLVIGANDAQVRERLRRLPLDDGEGLPAGALVGTPAEVVDRLGALAQAGVERVMFQHLLHEDFDALDLLAREVLTQIS